MNATELETIFARDNRIAYITHYPDGFVPNSYKWRCIRTANVYYRDGRHEIKTYDAKRARGVGPTWVAFSEAGGRIAKY